MSSPSKLSLLFFVTGFLILPFFAHAAAPFFGAAGTQTASDFRLSSLRASLSNFSLKNVDARIYTALKNKKSDQTAHFTPGSSHTHQCSDGLDNDGNGLFDFPDDYPNCASEEDLKEAVPQCNDRIDNDGDGGIDFGDGVDLDGDGGIDAPGDADCAFLGQEGEGTTQCSDGLDNDNDSPDGINSIDYYSGGVWGTGDTDCAYFDDDTEGGELLCAPSWRCLQTEPPGAVNPFVDIYFNNNPNINVTNVNGDAYDTDIPIYWNVEDSCSCTGDPGNWSNALTLNASGDSVSSQSVIVDTVGDVTYTLTCTKLSSCTSTLSDSVTITPLWSPSFYFSSPTLQVTANDDVSLEWSGNDLKSCTAGGWDGPSASALQTANGGALGQNQTHSVNLGKITGDMTYTLSCTGFNNVVLAQQTVNVTLLRNPTPYFFINGINLIIIGPGSGGRSNKATVGVTPGGGFTGTINLSAVRPPELVSANAMLHIEPSTVTCNGTSCTTAEFWVETPSDIPENTYTITLTADPVPAGFDSKTADIPLRVRRFVPAFEEI